MEILDINIDNSFTKDVQTNLNILFNKTFGKFTPLKI